MNKSQDLLIALFDELDVIWTDAKAELDAIDLPAFDTTKNTVVLLNRILQEHAQRVEDEITSGSGNIDETVLWSTDEQILGKYATAMGCGLLLQTISEKFRKQHLELHNSLRTYDG